MGGLTDSLANISEEELKKLFSPFGASSARQFERSMSISRGEIEFIDLHRDPYTNKCKAGSF